MIDGTEKPKIPQKFAKRTAQYNEFGSKGALFKERAYSCTGEKKKNNSEATQESAESYEPQK